jgi:hypothetical protein
MDGALQQCKQDKVFNIGDTMRLSDAWRDLLIRVRGEFKRDRYQCCGQWRGVCWLILGL